MRVWKLGAGRAVQELSLPTCDGVLGIQSDGVRVWIHQRHGLVRGYELVDGRLSPASGGDVVLQCGDYSFCRMHVFRHAGRLLASLPSTSSPDALDVWDLDRGCAVVRAIGGAAAQKTGAPLLRRAAPLTLQAA